MEPKSVRRATDRPLGPAGAPYACHGIPVATPILTEAGPRPVEQLCIGDLVVTRNGGLQALRGIRDVIDVCRAIKFRAGSLGALTPERDLLLPEAQPVLIQNHLAQTLFGQNQAMIRAGQLVDGTAIEDIGPRKLLLFQLDLGRARVIHAQGLDLGTESQASTPERAVA